MFNASKKIEAINAKPINAKSIMNILAAAIKPGTKLEISAHGWRVEKAAWRG